MAIGHIKSAKLEGTELTLKIQVDPKGEPSSTGKMNLIYTSGGWQDINVEGSSTRLKFNMSMGYRNGGAR